MLLTALLLIALGAAVLYVGDRLIAADPAGVPARPDEAHPEDALPHGA